MGVNYILSKLDNEIERLRSQHDTWSEETHRLWQRAQISKGMIGLDAGCGPGFASLELAELVGESGKIVSFDGTKRYLQYLNGQISERGIQNIQTQEGNILGTELEEGQFDFIFTRMVLLFISDLNSVVKEFLRVLRPGGKILISDFYTYGRSFIMSPQAPILEEVLDVIEADFKAQGCDLEVCQKLPQILPKMGLSIESLTPEYKLAKSGSRDWKWPEIFFTTFIPDLVQRGKLDESKATDFWNEWKELSTNPHAFFFSPIILNIVGIKQQ